MSLADETLAPYARSLTVCVKGHVIPLYKFIEHYLRITDKEGNVVPLIMKRPQVELYRYVCEQREARKPVRMNILKSRQIGYSTLIAAMLFSIGIFGRNVKVGVIADTEKHASDIFDKYQFFYDHLDDANPNLEAIREHERADRSSKRPHPDSMKPTLKATRAGHMMWTEAGNSKIEVLVAGDASGRGSTYNLLHCSECAFFKDLKSTLNGLLETVPSTEGSMVFLETTANGFNEYKDRWDHDSLGDSSYRPVFMPWYNEPEYRTREDWDSKTIPANVPKWLIDRAESYKLTNRQVMWYWNKVQDKGGDIGDAFQEYPFCPTDAFVSSGNCAFDIESIAARKRYLEEHPNLLRQGRFLTRDTSSPDRSMVDLQILGFEERRDGFIRIYEEPVKGHPYIANLDPAMGGEDSYVIQVIDNATLKQVAVYATNRPGLDDDVAHQLVALGRMYNDAYISAECNNANGTYILMEAERCGYRNIYKDSRYDSVSDTWMDKYGYETTVANKNPMVAMLKKAFAQDPSFVNDYQTLCEMESFSVYRSQTGSHRESYSATSGKHDDRVMALAGALYVRDSRVQSFLVREDKPKPNAPNGIVPFRKPRQEKMKGAFVIW